MDIEKIKQEMLDKKIWAVVGATSNREKYGYKIYKKLKDKGYEVYPINPGYEEIEGDKCYNSISELPVKPDCVNIVVPPRISNKVIEEIANEGIEYVWLQPGTFTEETIDLAESKNLKFVYYDCVLVALD
ncbi:CoA-binding protein [Caminicella sporogenes]|uniref:CoA-binding protein n=1 Tax=Caminicella sporogenes TaxID=166485 RepID=UPI00254171C4|nr:CoA-binding protein [Caminicella sporogenes]WIF94345.1 CoA-binding protein [Caminicella sporogenes]